MRHLLLGRRRHLRRQRHPLRGQCLAADNVVRNNRHLGPGGKIVNDANAVCENNTGYASVTE